MIAESSALRRANVFLGPDSIVKYLNPDRAAYTSLVELPAGTKLNPFPVSDQVRIFVKVMGAELPGHSFKLVPVYAWYEKQKHRGKITAKTVVHINSSGGAGFAAVLVGRALGVHQVRVYMPEDTPGDKQKLIKRAGGKLILTKDQPGRPSNVERLRKKKLPPHHLVFDQYGDDVNWKAHLEVTMKQITKQMAVFGSFPGVMAAAKGTTGTLLAARETIWSRSRKRLIVGVECKEGEPIPAVRPKSRLGPDQILFDHTKGTWSIDVARYDSYQMTVDLLRVAALKLGLSTGAALCGALRGVDFILGNPLASRSYRDIDGYLNVVVVSGDSLDPYLEQLRVILDAADL